MSKTESLREFRIKELRRLDEKWSLGEEFSEQQFKYRAFLREELKLSTKIMKKTNTKQRIRVEKWLINNKRFINITGIEKSIAAPKGLIQKFLKYDKGIDDKWIERIHSVIKGMTKFTLR